MGAGFLPPIIKWPGRDADHSVSYSAEGVLQHPLDVFVPCSGTTLSSLDVGGSDKMFYKTA